MRNYVLLTGATGLLGQYLVRDMLLDGHRVAVLVRPTKKQTPAQRIEQTMQMWDEQLGRPLPRPVVIPGDITQEGLGLSPEDQEWVKSHCTTMLHCAASLQFVEHKGEPWRTNIDGTKNVLSFCEANEINEMHYVSTAYVCGHRQEVVMEDDLDVGQEFRNDYEQSKFTAEKMVRECPAFAAEKLTVYRPVVITGDSETGYTSTYHGTYLYMKLASVLRGNVEPNEKGEYHIPVRWGLKGDERRNITAVEWNSKVMLRIFNTPEAHGKTLHMAPSDPITMKDAIDYASDYYKLTGIEFHGFGTNPPHTLNEMERWLWNSISIYGSYDFMDPQFDTTNLLKFAGDIHCPKLTKEMAFLLMDYAEEDKWGKRKRPAVIDAKIDVQSHLSSITAVATDQPTSTIAIDVLGPGGSPWTVRMGRDGITAYERGLSPEAAATLSISSEELAELQGQGSAAASALESRLAGEEVDVTRLAEALLPQTIENS
ncbi:MAG: SDR family oxidoreductase [Planctomycetota bacterium]